MTNILCLNFFWGNGYYDNWIDYLLAFRYFFYSKNKKATMEIAHVINKYDIDLLCAQEVMLPCRYNHQHDMINVLTKNTQLKHHIFGSERKGYWIDGNAIFSKETLKGKVTPLPAVIEPRCFISVTFPKFTLINTHLAAIFTIPNERAKQAKVIADYIAGLDTPVILCGDFNAGEHSNTDNVLKKECNRVPLPPTYPAHDPRKMFDAVYTKNIQVKARVLNEKISDHLPVLVSLI